MRAKSTPRSAASRRSGSAGTLDADLVDDLVAANRTLARLGVLDAFGHASVRDPRDPRRYLISRSIAPESAAVVLMRGHGDSVVGPSLPNAVFRAYYTEINARQQLAAITIGGPINFMTRAEAMTSNDTMLRASARPWALWRKQALAQR